MTGICSSQVSKPELTRFEKLHGTSSLNHLIMFRLAKSMLRGIAVGGLLLGVALADNPIIQTLYSTDPAPVVYNNTVYLFTGHDETGARNYDMRDWRLYSSTDMVNWRDHGMILSVKNFSWATRDAWAAQVIERDGKFYYYGMYPYPFCHRRSDKHPMSRWD